MTHDPRVSVAVPLYNEEALVGQLIDRIGRVLDHIPGGPHEILFVDDGSTDETFGVLERSAESDPRITIISFSRNFGHQAAITAALEHVSGDVAVVMDGDLQDCPEEIPEFLKRYHEGYDVVYATRVKRKEPLWLRAGYLGFYRMMARMSRVKLPLDAGDFGLMSRRVVDELRRTPERHRYLRGLRAWAGFRQIGIPVERALRAGGKSKFSLAKLLGLAFDGMFSFSIVPLRLATLLGAVTVLFSTFFAVYSLYAKFFLSQSPRGFTALILVITFVSGVNLLFLGVIGEYLGRVYEEVKGRPLYVIRETVSRQQPAVLRKSRANDDATDSRPRAFPRIQPPA